jgi:DnaK suppressor protein
MKTVAKKTVSKALTKQTQKVTSKLPPKVVTKTVTKTASKVAAKKAAVPVKAVKKPVAKTVPKATAKKIVKTIAKPATKAGSKVVSKTTTKATTKATTNAATNAIAKPNTKVAASPNAKTATKAVVKVTQAKVQQAKVPQTKVQQAKEIKPIKSKSVDLTSSKTAKKIDIKKVEAAAEVKIVKAAKTLEKTKAASKSSKVESNIKQPMEIVSKIATPETKESLPAAPAQSKARTSRLASLTVPSMAQTVASTAAKSSYGPHIPSFAIIPPPQFAAKHNPKLSNNWKTKSAEEMSDAELLAMPDSEYMNIKQMMYFRLKLTQLKQGILANAGATSEHLRDESAVVPDPTDRATIEEEHALELRTRDRERKLLKKIEQSIVRIDAGDYGYCDETGEAIGVGRLLARPTATLSLEAQQRRELKQKMFGD